MDRGTVGLVEMHLRSTHFLAPSGAQKMQMNVLELTIFIFLPQVSLRSVSGQFQVSFRSGSGQSQVSLRSVSGHSVPTLSVRQSLKYLVLFVFD